MSFKYFKSQPGLRASLDETNKAICMYGKQTNHKALNCRLTMYSILDNAVLDHWMCPTLQKF